MGYLAILAAMPVFLLSTLFTMLLWAIIAPNFRIEKIDCLRLAVAPLAAAAGRRAIKQSHREGRETD